MLDIVGFSNNSITIDYENVISLVEGVAGNGALLGDLTIRDIVASIFGASDDNKIANIAFSLGDFEYGVMDSNYNALVSGLQKNSYGVESPVDKVYNSELEVPALSSKLIVSNVEGKDYVDLFIADKDYDHGADENLIYRKSEEGAMSMLSAEELEGAANYSVHYTYTDIYGVEHTQTMDNNGSVFQARIVDIVGYDPEASGPQKVTIYTVSADGGNLLSQLNGLLALIGLDLKFAANKYEAYIEINAEVESTTAVSAGGTASGNVVSYTNGTEELTITYGEEGTSKTDSTIIVYGSILGDNGKYLNITVKYAGSEETKNIKLAFAETDITFANPDAVKQIEYRQLTGTMIPQWIATAPGANSITISTALGDFTWDFTAVEPEA